MARRGQGPQGAKATRARRATRAEGAKGDTGPRGLASVTAYTNDVDISTGDSGGVNVMCPDGTTLVAGGADTQNPTATVTRDMPTLDGVPAAEGETPDGWYAGAKAGVEGINLIGLRPLRGILSPGER